MSYAKMKHNQLVCLNTDWKEKNPNPLLCAYSEKAVLLKLRYVHKKNFSYNFLHFSYIDIALSYSQTLLFSVFYYKCTIPELYVLSP